ncbi:MAG: hypothetical protein Q9192_004818 [Flavoplaca navasiana]
MAESVQPDPQSSGAGDVTQGHDEQSAAGLQSPASAVERDQSSTGSLSLSGSVFEQVLENDRGYANESYFMPCDEKEQTRLAITQQCFTSMLGGQLCFQNIPRNAKRILDVGTGIGDWAIAVAERFPTAEITATDITCFQPTDVPPNVFFEIDDAQEEWTYTEPFDFIHLRGLSGAFSDWTAVYKKAHKHLQANGILEVADFGFITTTEPLVDSYLSIYNGACLSAAEKAGITLGLDHMKKSLLESAGFSIAKTRTLDIPLGTWSNDPRKKLAGKMALISALEGLEARSLRMLTRHMDWKAEDVRDLCDKVQVELMRPGVRPTMPCQFTVARKLMRQNTLRFAGREIMSPPVASAKLTLSYPLYASDFDPQNSSFLLVGGGGGEGRTGVGNKIVMFADQSFVGYQLIPYQTLINSSRKQSISEVVDIDLSKNEDSVTSLAIASSTASSVTAFAGINSSQEDQDAGRNDHLRSFLLEYPPKKQKDAEEGRDMGTQTYKGQTAALGRASLFTTSTAAKRETYQRVTRLSRPCKINGGQLGAIATGLAPEGEIVLFDAKTNGPMGPWVEARLPLGQGVEAADVDIIGLNDIDDSPPGTFAVAYCTDYEVHAFSMTLKQKANPEPRFSYGEPHPDVFASKTRPKFRSLRFITPHLLLLSQNRPNRQGADLLLLELSSSYQGKVICRKSLHRGINAATALSVTHLASSETSQSNQLVVAVAGQDTSIETLTLEYAYSPPYKSLKLRSHTILRSVHPQQITSLSLSTFLPPVAAGPSAPPQYIKLASTSIASTVVVHTFPLIPFPSHSQKSTKRRYVLTSPGRSDAATMGLSIIVSAFAVALGAFFLQAFTEIRGASPEYLGAKGWLSQRIHDYVAIPYILENGTRVAPSTAVTRSFSESASASSSSSIFDQITDTLAEVTSSASDTATTAKEILYDNPEEARAAVSSALDAASSAAAELNAASEAYSATASSTISSLTSSVAPRASAASHHVRDLLSRHFKYRQQQPPDSEMHHMVIHDDGESGKLKAGFHRPGKEGSSSKVVKFENLSRKEKEIWKQRLKEAGVWAVDEGEAVLKGVFFGSVAGAVGAAVRGAMG